MNHRSLTLYGDQTESGSFRCPDLKRFPSLRPETFLPACDYPVSVHCVNTHFVIRTPAELYNHLGQSRQRKNQRVGLMNVDSFEYTYKVKLDVVPEAVNFVMVQNESLIYMPLTPWMVAHRLMHAFQFVAPVDSPADLRAWRKDTARFLVNRCLDIEKLPSINTKAFRSRSLTGVSEYFPEIFAYWCTHGNVRLQAPDDDYSDIDEVLERRHRSVMKWAMGRVLVL